MINDKNAFQEDAYRLLVAHISQHALLQGGSASDPGGYLPLVGGGGLPLVLDWELCIPVCTGADPTVDRMTDICKNIAFANFVCGR